MNNNTFHYQYILIEGTTDGPINFCYHLWDLPKKKPLEVRVRRPFRIVCSICKGNVTKELASKEIIFELEKMKDWSVKYGLMAKGIKKVSDIMIQKRILKLWDEPFFVEFLKLFEIKEQTDEVMYEDLIWAVKEFQFDEELYKFAIHSPEFEGQFHPKRNVNVIDVRFIMERMIPLFNIYHKIYHPGTHKL
jgi:hypothetical protein